MISNGLDELGVQIVFCPCILKIRVGIRRETLRVIYFHMCIIGPQHVKSHQVDDSFLPGAEHGVIKILYGILIVVFDLVESTFVRHIPLPSDIGHRVKLQEDEVWHVSTDGIEEVVHRSMVVGHLWHTVQHCHSISCVV